MKAYKCDRCKACYDIPSTMPKSAVSLSPYRQDDQVDLCPLCQGELEDFLNLPKDKRTTWAKKPDHEECGRGSGLWKPGDKD